MATPKTINGLTERSGDLALTDEIEVQVSGATSTVKKALSYIKKLVIGTATIGGSATTDIPTLASTGTFTNKRFTNPLINSATPVTIYGEWINNWMNTLQTYNSANDLIRLAGVTSPVQAQLTANSAAAAAAQASADAVDQRVDDLAWAQRYDYNVSVGAGASTLEISDTTILTGMGLTGYIEHLTTIVSYYEEDSANSKLIKQASSGITVFYKTAGSTIVLDKIRFTVTSGKSYAFYINFKTA
jgi:hypothetical protein